MSYLYIVSSKSVKADPTKIEAISQFPDPTPVKKPNYVFSQAWQTNWADSLTYLVKQQPHFGTCLNQKNLFFWSPQHEEAFTKP